MNDEMNDGWFSDDTATFGDRLAGARDRSGLTQNDLAKRLGVKLTTLEAWEDDRSEPRANKLQMVSGLLGVSLGWLMTGEGEGPEAPDQGDALPRDVDHILFEIRQVRAGMTRASERLAQLEKQLRLTLKDTAG